MVTRSLRVRGLTASVAFAVTVLTACSSGPSGPSSTALQVTSITPSTGSTTGAITVTVSGKNFGSDTTLSVGGVATTQLMLLGSTTITALLGTRSSPGAADVVVTSGGKSATLPKAFTFVAPSGGNQPPQITDIRSIGSRPRQPSGFGDLGETVTLVATVNNAETPASALEYEWSGPGTFSGAGSTVTWRLPTTASATPTPVVATVTVAEPYTENGVVHRNVSTSTFVMQVHDSQEEILAMGEDFLTLFSKSELTTDQVLHNFSTTCDGGRGRDSEASDVDRSRREYVQDFSKFRITRLPPVTFNFGGVCLAFGEVARARKADACSLFRVHWEVTYISGGKKEVTDGIDHVTAVLENNRWRLCHSDFQGVAVNPTLGTSRFVEW